jgi:hypothetical protein
VKLTRILLILARLLAFAAVAETMIIWVFWRSTWTPIERHYLPAACTLTGFALAARKSLRHPGQAGRRANFGFSSRPWRTAVRSSPNQSTHLGVSRPPLKGELPMGS